MKDKTSFGWLDAVRIGLIGGAALVLVSLVGMVAAFDQRDIIVRLLSMGHTLLLGILLSTAYMAASRAPAPRRGTTLAAALLAGVTAEAVLAGLVLVGQVVNLRPVLVNASPALYSILTFDAVNRSVVLGVIYMLAQGAVVGVIAGALHLLPARLRSTVFSAMLWVGVLGLLQELIRVTLTNQPILAALTGWMFAGRGQKGLTVIGAIAVFAAVMGGRSLWEARGDGVRESVAQLPAGRRRALRWALLGAAFLLLLYLPNLLGLFLSDVANTVGIFILMGVGLNIVVGFSGLLDLGYVAFFAIGAYVMGVLTSTSGEIVWAPHLSFWEALPIAVATAVVAGVLLGIPVLKIRGDYLAIVTLGFGEIIRILALSDFLKPYIGGSQGIVQVGRGVLGPVVLDKPGNLYYLVLAGCLLAVFVSTRLKDSRPGRAWMAMREDEDVAQAMGIPLVPTKLLAFGSGAAFGGLAGAIFASKLGTIYPHSFALLVSINVLSLIIVGGMGSIPGVIVGALALVGLPELLREFAEFRLLVYGAVLIGMMLLRPEGLWPEETRKRELHEVTEPTTAVGEATREPQAAA